MGFGLHPFSFKATWVPVSYTHLDVYKRQGLIIALCPHSSDYMRYRNFNLLSIYYVFRPRLRPRLTQSRSALPVSYTHLDVYKRQVPYLIRSPVVKSYPCILPLFYCNQESYPGTDPVFPNHTNSADSDIPVSYTHLIPCYGIFRIKKDS